MNIDVETGLPVLPEGFYWRIIEETYSYLDYELLVEICCSNTYVEDVCEDRRFPRTWRRFFGPEPTGFESVKIGEQEVTKVIVYASTPMKDSHTTDSREERDKLLNDGTGWDYANDQSYHKDEVRLVRLWEPTPENILKAATASLEKFNKKRADEERERKTKEARKAVIGAYPPKKLVQ